MDSFPLVLEVMVRGTSTERAVGESPWAEEVLPVVLLFPALLFTPTVPFPLAPGPEAGLLGRSPGCPVSRCVSS